LSRIDFFKISFYFSLFTRIVYLNLSTNHTTIKFKMFRGFISPIFQGIINDIYLLLNRIRFAVIGKFDTFKNFWNFWHVAHIDKQVLNRGFFKRHAKDARLVLHYIILLGCHLYYIYTVHLWLKFKFRTSNFGFIEQINNLKKEGFIAQKY